MNNSEYLVLIVLAVFVLFGFGNFIFPPILARRFYRDVGFVDHGKSLLEIPTDSELLKPLAMSHLYRGQHRGHPVEHFKAYPKARRKFTPSKVMRKHNQSRWSVTQLNSGKSLPSFCLLPISEPTTVFLMLNDSGVNLSDDKDIKNRYYLRTAHPEQIKRLITGDIKKFLIARELISIECVNNTVLIKRGLRGFMWVKSLGERVNNLV
jgi:hypothetical protein